MHVQIQRSDRLASGNADNATATAQIIPSAGRAVRVTGVHFGFTGVAATGNVLTTLSDGTSTLRFAVAPTTPLDAEMTNPLSFAAGATVTATLNAGGAAGCIGNVTLCGYEVDPTKGE